MNKQVSLVFFLCANAFYLSAYARTTEPVNPLSSNTMVGSVSVGALWADAGKRQTFFLTPQVEKTYTSNSATSVFPDVQLFLGTQKILWPEIVARLGFFIDVAGNASANGIIWDDADPEYDNYSYSYKIRSTKLGLKGMFLLDKDYFLMPWVGAHIGAAFNYAYAFNNNPLISEAVPNNNFMNHTSTYFTYALSAGVQKTLNSNWQVGVGYEFSDWSKAMLGRASGQTINSGLVSKNVYTNGLVFNITSLS